jgi:hypothetical protein
MEWRIVPTENLSHQWPRLPPFHHPIAVTGVWPDWAQSTGSPTIRIATPLAVGLQSSTYYFVGFVVCMARSAITSRSPP